MNGAPTVKVAYQARHQVGGLSPRQMDDIEAALVEATVSETDPRRYRSVEEIGGFRVLWERDERGDPVVLGVVATSR